MSADLRLGRWQDVLADVDSVDSVITDAPYSARTHAGAMSATGERGVQQYDSWSPDDAVVFCLHWAPRCRGWTVIHTDDVLAPAMIGALLECDRYVFPMLPVLQHQPRLTGDGPSQHGHYLVVSRPKRREFLSWGSLPGWYEAPREKGEIRGAKPLGLVSAIVRDYSRPGDLVCDPFVGSGTTAVAALTEGRRFVGSEAKPEHYEIAKRRLAKGYTPSLFT